MAAGCLASLAFWGVFAVWFTTMLTGAPIAPLLAFLLAVVIAVSLLIRALRSDWPLY
jgi:hypothetical protein